MERIGEFIVTVKKIHVGDFNASVKLNVLESSMLLRRVHCWSNAECDVKIGAFGTTVP